MRFYASWYPGDPWYPHYDPDAAVLVSVTSVSRQWQVAHQGILPRYLILDSGGYRYALAPGERPSPRQNFERQLRMLGDSEVETTLCASDHPILSPNTPSNERDRSVSQTIAYAYEFKELAARRALPPHIHLMAIIQGGDVASAVHCAWELKQLGFSHYGLGSLAMLFSHKQIMERVTAVREVIGENLHIFGISGILTMRELRALGITSIDSSRPAKAAMYNQVFYSHPFRRYSIAAEKLRPGAEKPQAAQLRVPLPCDCPICQGGRSADLVNIGRREHVFARTLHNFWHLKRALLF